MKEGRKRKKTRRYGMIQYRKAKRSELEEVAHLSAEAFCAYPMFDVVLHKKFKDKKSYIKFTKELHHVLVKAYTRKHCCFVGIDQKEIVSMALLQRPDMKEVSLWDYVLSGGVKLILQGGVKTILKLMEISHEASKKIKNQCKEAWYVELLAVNSEYRGKSLGSNMIQNGIIPFVKKHNGKAITLITNTQINRKFYKKNGFIELSESSITNGGRTIGNWSYCLNL